jgi:hypothetical protein
MSILLHAKLTGVARLVKVQFLQLNFVVLMNDDDDYNNKNNILQWHVHTNAVHGVYFCGFFY